MKKCQTKNDRLLNDLEKASGEKNKALRGIKIAAVLSKSLNKIGIEPILVGGAAVAYYTEGAYMSQDIDMIAPTTDNLKKMFSDLGFKKIGKDFINKNLKIYVEFPSENLGPTEKVSEITVENRKIKIISIEDLIVDRLCAFKYWKSGIDGVNALIMLELGIANKKAVENRAREEDVLDALDYVESVLQDSTRLKKTPIETSKMLMKYFKK